MIAGALHRIDTATLQTFSNCMKENEDPIAVNSCLAQCFHIHPDVNYLHMHTTAGVERMRDGPGDSGLGPDTDRASHPWAYNVCACEPTSWQKTYVENLLVRPVILNSLLVVLSGAFVQLLNQAIPDTSLKPLPAFAKI